MDSGVGDQFVFFLAGESNLGRTVVDSRKRIQVLQRHQPDQRSLAAGLVEHRRRFIIDNTVAGRVEVEVHQEAEMQAGQPRRSNVAHLEFDDQDAVVVSVADCLLRQFDGDRYLRAAVDISCHSTHTTVTVDDRRTEAQGRLVV